MKLIMYSVYDTIACVFNKPFCDINDASAIRSFDQSAGEQPHFGDYELYRVGEYDDSNGYITPLDVARIRTGHETLAAYSKQKSLDIES